MMNNKLFAAAICFLCLSLSAFSQSRTFIGGQLSADFDLDDGFHPEPSIGVVINKQYTTHSGMEVALFYRRTHNDFYIPSSGYSSFADIRITRHHLVLPFSYKFYSKKVCFSAGIALSQYLGWSDNGSDVEVDKYKSSEDGTDVGLFVTFSKPINLSERDVLEPFIYINPMAHDALNLYTGIGLAYKFQTRKKD